MRKALGCNAMITQKDLDPQQEAEPGSQALVQRGIPISPYSVIIFQRENYLGVSHTINNVLTLRFWKPCIYSKGLEVKEHKKVLEHISQNSKQLVLTPASRRLTRQEAAEGASPQVLSTGPCCSLVPSRNRNTWALDSAVCASQTPKAKQKCPDLDLYPSVVWFHRLKSSEKTDVGTLAVCLSLLFQSCPLAS